MYKIAHEDPDLRLIPRGAKWDRLRALLTRAFFKDAVRRYPTAAAMSADLTLALQDLGGPLDDTAASDRGMLRRASYTAPAAVRTAGASAPVTSDARPGTPPPAAPPPPPVSAAAPRPAWRQPAVIGVAVLTATAAAMVVLLVWPRGDSSSSTPTPPTTRPRGDGGSLVSGGARLARPSAAPPSLAPPASRPTPTAMPRASALPPVVVSAPPPAAAGDGDRGAQTASATAQLDRASDLYEKGRYASALAEAKAVLRREPANREAKSLVEDIEADMAVAARLKQAQDAMRRGDREEALAQVRAGLAVKNNDGRLLSLFKELTQ
jgi:hypothetical protein